MLTLAEELHEIFYQPEKRRNKIFLSHAHEDMETVKKLVEWLNKKTGVHTFVDALEMEYNPSPEIAQQLIDVMKTSIGCLLLVSEESLKSPWVIWEVGIASGVHNPNRVLILQIGEAQKLTESMHKVAAHYPGFEYLELYPQLKCSKYPADNSLWVLHPSENVAYPFPVYLERIALNDDPFTYR